MSNYVWRAKEKCQSDPPNLQQNTSINRKNGNRNQTPSRACLKKDLNVSKFLHNSSVTSAQNMQEEDVVVAVDTTSETKPKVLLPTQIPKINPTLDEDPTLPSSSYPFKGSNKPKKTRNNKPKKTRKKYRKRAAKRRLPIYRIPVEIRELIKRDIVPPVLKKPLSPSTYKDYFATLLYAEDYYIQKWDGYEMPHVSMELKLKKVETHWNNGEPNMLKNTKIFLKFDIEPNPQKRPFLLSRDFAFVRPSGTQDEPFQGVIYRVVRSKYLLVEVGKDFFEQHHPTCTYDVKFSLNRVCLKRAHQAIEAASDVLIGNFLFPHFLEGFLHYDDPELDRNEQTRAVHQIVNHQIGPPYRLQGPLSVTNGELTTTGKVIQEVVVQLCQRSSSNQILICAPTNSACDVLMRSLQKKIPESDIFRSNAAFRELNTVPNDILRLCRYQEQEELFPCPPLEELENFSVISSTFMSSFRLKDEGLTAGHFSHIFLVDASSAIEPEILVPLANLASEETAVVVTGAPKNSPGWVRSFIAKQNGLKRSYFERLRGANCT